MLGTENKFGPDKNLPLAGVAVRIRIPNKKKLSICFDSNALWENALIIYEGIRSTTGGPMTYQELSVPVEKGNYPEKTGRNLSRVEIVNPSPNASMFVLFSGWHKKGEPNAELGWEPSKFRALHYRSTGEMVILVDDSIADWGKIGFEDDSKGDGDFNDIVAFYRHL